MDEVERKIRILWISQTVSSENALKCLSTLKESFYSDLESQSTFLDNFDIISAHPKHSSLLLQFCEQDYKTFTQVRRDLRCERLIYPRNGWKSLASSLGVGLMTSLSLYYSFPSVVNPGGSGSYGSKRVDRVQPYRQLKPQFVIDFSTIIRLLGGTLPMYYFSSKYLLKLRTDRIFTNWLNRNVRCLWDLDFYYRFYVNSYFNFYGPSEMLRKCWKFFLIRTIFESLFSSIFNSFFRKQSAIVGSKYFLYQMIRIPMIHASNFLFSYSFHWGLGKILRRFTSLHKYFHRFRLHLIIYFIFMSFTWTIEKYLENQVTQYLFGVTEPKRKSETIDSTLEKLNRRENNHVLLIEHLEGKNYAMMTKNGIEKFESEGSEDMLQQIPILYARLEDTEDDDDIIDKEKMKAKRICVVVLDKNSGYEEGILENVSRIKISSSNTDEEYLEIAQRIFMDEL